MKRTRKVEESEKERKREGSEKNKERRSREEEREKKAISIAQIRGKPATYRSDLRRSCVCRLRAVYSGDL